MARKSRLNSPLATETADPVLRAPKIPLTLEEREALRTIFKDSTFVKAWNNAQWAKPNAFPGNLDSALGHVIATNRLHEIRGWEMCIAALTRAIVEPELKKPRTPEDYPEDLGPAGPKR